MNGIAGRAFGFTAAVMLVSSSAAAEVWMLKPAGGIGCQDADALKSIDATQLTLPAGCVRLYAGERVIEQPNGAAGFADYIKVERSNRSKVFVSSSSLVADPGIGSVDDNR